MGMEPMKAAIIHAREDIIMACRICMLMDTSIRLKRYPTAKQMMPGTMKYGTYSTSAW